VLRNLCLCDDLVGPNSNFTHFKMSVMSSGESIKQVQLGFILATLPVKPHSLPIDDGVGTVENIISNL
jgi:hypothetical protein